MVPCVNVEGHCYSVTEHYLDRICNMIGWRGMTTEDQGLPDTNVELVTNLLAHLGKTQPVVRGSLWLWLSPTCTYPCFFSLLTFFFLPLTCLLAGSLTNLVSLFSPREPFWCSYQVGMTSCPYRISLATDSEVR